MGALTQAGVGFAFVALSAAMYLRNRFATIRAVLVFLGICLMGAGIVTSIASWTLGFAESIFGNTVGKWLGIGFQGLMGGIVIVLVFLVLHDWMPRNSAKKSSYWLSAALAAICVAGLTPFAVLNGLPAQIANIHPTQITSVQGG